MKIVVNKSYGVFSISPAMAELYQKKTGTLPERFERNDPILVEVVAELGKKANTWASSLEIYNIPDEATDYMINEYDGYETIIYVLDGELFEM